MRSKKNGRIRDYCIHIAKTCEASTQNIDDISLPELLNAFGILLKGAISFSSGILEEKLDALHSSFEGSKSSFQKSMMICTAVQLLGYPQSIGYQNVMYPSSFEKRDILLFLSQKAQPKTTIRTFSKNAGLGNKMSERKIDRRISYALQKWTADAWCPVETQSIIEGNATCCLQIYKQLPSLNINRFFVEAMKLEKTLNRTYTMVTQVSSDQRISKFTALQNRIKNLKIHESDRKDKVENLEKVEYCEIGHSENSTNTCLILDIEEKQGSLQKLLDANSKISNEMVLLNNVIRELLENTSYLNSVASYHESIKTMKKLVREKDLIAALLPEAEHSIMQMLLKIDKFQESIKSWQDEWARLESEHVSELFHLRESVQFQEEQYNVLRDRFCFAKQDNESGNQDLSLFQKHKQELIDVLSKAGSYVNRQALIRRIFHISRYLDKQILEISKILSDVVRLKRNISTSTHFIDESESCIRALFIAAARGKGPDFTAVIGKAYDFTLFLFKVFHELLGELGEIESISMESLRLQERLDAQHAQDFAGRLRQILNDMSTVKSELGFV